ncbi:fimbrial biogenesis chaperone [Stenotrophomonas maltophilia]|uniref:fimbrial biogenesis chaperone n=1 Tax=Stenotrophomonas maltophilia TaxID=40324 RepID=UPI00021E0B16|nr:molecular chaperone [Stenotrophomonas maltophilia]AEM51478.1 Pili assembly chaperone [Stenotrophomonas maltophilia JV3]
MLNIKTPLMMAGCAAALAFSALDARASVVMHGTRVVFAAQEREASLRLQNVGSTTDLVQAWIDDGRTVSETPVEESAVPFFMRPPIFRMEAGRSQLLRIFHTGESMPADRESLYYLNVLAVPGKPADAADGVHLNVVVRTRMKLFYRPKGLSGAGAAAAPSKLQWALVKDANGWVLNTTNPTPYHVSVDSIRAGGKIVADIALPLATTSYRLSHAQANALGSQVTFQYISDHGGTFDVTSPLARP